jgi:hypothetical protein
MHDPFAAIRRLVEAGRDLSRDASLIDPLVTSTGLSREGVELALAQHLETSPEDADLARLVKAAGHAERVHVILSSNVFVGALRALAFARAASDCVTVSPSRREPVFARALVERAADPALSIDEGIAVSSITSGAIHVYGRDETIRDVVARAAPCVRVHGHGSGLGVAVVTRTSARAAAEAIARDVVPFDQRGCLSPRLVVFVGASGADELCEELHRELTAWQEKVPRGSLDPEESSAAARYVDTLAFAGHVWRGKAHAIGLGPPGAPLTLPPAGRHVHVAIAADARAAQKLLAPLGGRVAALGCDEEEVAQVVRGGWKSRVSGLGRMQRPPLDGPVDVR